jgi:hypothetical protein
MASITPFRKTFEPSQELILLTSKLREVEISGVISYGELSACIGKDVRKYRAVLQTARKNLWADNIVFGCVRNVGLQRFTDEETVCAMHQGRHKISKAARREVRKSAAIDYVKLSPLAQISYSVTCGVLMAVGVMTSDRAMKALTSGEHTQTALDLPIKALIETLMKKNGG